MRLSRVWCIRAWVDLSVSILCFIVFNLINFIYFAVAAKITRLFNKSCFLLSFFFAIVVVYKFSFSKIIQSEMFFFSHTHSTNPIRLSLLSKGRISDVWFFSFSNALEDIWWLVQIVSKRIDKLNSQTSGYQC